MATPAEKNAFINSLYNFHQACDSKANDGALTTDQRSVFITEIIYLNSDIGRTWNRDFEPIPSNLVQHALLEIAEGISATKQARDDSTVRIAAKELFDANKAIDDVLGY